MFTGPPPPKRPPPLPRRTPGAQGFPAMPARVVRSTEPAAAANALPPLDMKLLAELPSLNLQARYMAESFLSGRHRSPRKGSSVEFAEYRDYQPGDDLRRVDWRLYGRTERLHVKQYEEETQLRIFVVLDSSASMDFQSQPGLLRKIEFARIALAALALLAQRQGDAFGLGIVGTELAEFMRARSSVPHWRSFVGKLETVVPSGETSLAKALTDLAEVVPRRSMIVIASDFYEDLPALEAALRRLRYDHHEPIGLHVLDPVEIDFDIDEAGSFTDVETGARLKLDAPSVRKGYIERFTKFCGDLDDLFHGAGGELVRLRTDASPLSALTRYLHERKDKL